MKAKTAMVAATVTHRVVDRSVRHAPAMEARTQLTGPATATTRTNQKIMSRLWFLRNGSSDDGTRATMAERLKIVCSGMDPRTVLVWAKVYPGPGLSPHLRAAGPALQYPLQDPWQGPGRNLSSAPEA